MTQGNSASVTAAFGTLLEEIEAEIIYTNGVGSRAFEARDYGRAQEALEQAEQLSAFREKVLALRLEWDRLAPITGREATSRRSPRRLRPGLRTRAEEYYRPILRVLDRRGGSGPVGDVLDEVHQEMRGILRDVDFEPLPSDGSMPRWRNTAQWARISMVKAGLLKSGSPRGVWEITRKGREYLKENP